MFKTKGRHTMKSQGEACSELKETLLQFSPLARLNVLNSFCSTCGEYKILSCVPCLRRRIRYAALSIVGIALLMCVIVISQ